MVVVGVQETCRGIVVDAQLHPDHLGADSDGGIHDARHRLRLAEDVDHIDRLPDVGEVRHDGLAQDRLADRDRIDGDDPEALALEILHDEVAGPVPVRAGTDHGNGPGAPKDGRKLLVRVCAGAARRSRRVVWITGEAGVRREDLERAGHTLDGTRRRACGW